jgi:hypothetical protein
MIIYLLIFLINHGQLATSQFSKVAYASAVKNLLNEGILSFPVINIVETFRAMNFPLLHETINVIFKSQTKILAFLIRVCQYYILSSIPFLLGYLKSFRQGMEFGIGESYMGIFQNAHGASTVTTIATLVLVFYSKNHSLKLPALIYNRALIALGIYCVYLAFVRTGYLMLGVGIVIILWPSKISFRQTVAFILIFAALSGAFSYLIETNSEFSQRIFDLSSDDQQRDFGSGREKFAEYSLEYWADGNAQQLFFGRGIMGLMMNLEERYGMDIVSHNGFVDALTTNGIVGLALMILFIYYFYRLVHSGRNTKTYRLGLATLVLYITFQITQGGSGFPMDLLMALILSIIRKEKNENENGSASLV